MEILLDVLIFNLNIGSWQDGFCPPELQPLALWSTPNGLSMALAAGSFVNYIKKYIDVI